MPRILLLVPTATYRAPDFLDAARRLGVDVVVGSEDAPPLGAAVVVPLCDTRAAVERIIALDRERPIDAVVAVDDQGVVAAAGAGEVLGFPHNPPDAAEATRDKHLMRTRLAAAEVPQPPFEVWSGPGNEPMFGFPCVVKPTGLAASRGVIRADDLAALDTAAARIRRFWDGELLVERFVPGREVALEGLLRAGRLDVLALFDKPDPLDGPFFEETLYITPSRLAPSEQRMVVDAAARAAAAMGLREGAVHAELRIAVDSARVGQGGAAAHVSDGAAGNPVAPVNVIEVAARSIGGLCARALRFGAGISLEEVILRHALGLDSDSVTRTPGASGVLMIPIPRAGILVDVRGQTDALAVPGVDGVEITAVRGRPIVPLPEGDRYLGFVFAHADTPDAVEMALRTAHGRLMIDIS